MFRWKRRNEGFEWRTYVRTTVLARRAKRRQQIEEVKEAAVESAREAGRRGAEAGIAGLDAGRRHAAAAFRRLREVGRWSADAGLAGLRLGGRYAALAVARRSVAGTLPTASSADSSLLSRVAGALRAGILGAGRNLAPAWAFLRRPDIDIQLLIAGGGLLLAALVRMVSRGFDAAASFTALAAVAALAAPLGPRLVTGARSCAARFGLSGAWERLIPTDPARSRRAYAVVLAIGAALLLGAGYWTFGSAPNTGDRAAIPARPSRNTLQGRAVAVSGDMVRIAQSTVRLAGIEAPEREQECERPGARRWRCGLAAREALTRLLRGRAVTCRLSGVDEAGRVRGVCQAGGDDVAAELVRRGHVFADPGLLAPYGGLEREAKAARVGFWRGAAERPSEYRAKRWDDAKRQAPDGCPIKGQLTAEGRVYVLPWSGAYNKVKPRLARGERWFCSEDEARAAGWKPS